MRDSILYYPTIAVRDVNWLKISLLVWDKVYRIVPEGIRPDDHADVAAAVDSGQVRAVDLSARDLQKTSEDFAGMLHRVGHFPDGLHTPYTRLHRNKIDQHLYPKLAALAKEIDPAGWLELPEELARGYMFYLAETVSQRRQLAKGTDDDASWTVAAYFTHEANFDDDTMNAEAEGYYTNVVLADVLPASLVDVSMKDVLEFVDKRRDEREHFRRTLGDLERDLAACESRDHAEVMLADFEIKLRRAADDFRRSMGFFNHDARHAVLTMGVSVGTGVFGALTYLANKYPGTMFEHFTVSGSLLMGAVAAHLDYGRAKQNQRDNMLGSYLVDIEGRLSSPRFGIGRYASNFHDFMHD